MTAKERATDIWVRYYQLLPDSVYSNEGAKQEAKLFSAIAANEILTEWQSCVVDWANQRTEKIVYWGQVIEEINKL